MPPLSSFSDRYGFCDSRALSPAGLVNNTHLGHSPGWGVAMVAALWLTGNILNLARTFSISPARPSAQNVNGVGGGGSRCVCRNPRGWLLD
jgi:hypothetical protein